MKELGFRNTNRVSTEKQRTATQRDRKNLYLSMLEFCFLFAFSSSYSAIAQQISPEPQVYQAEAGELGGAVPPKIQYHHSCYYENGVVNFPRNNGFLRWNAVNGGSGGLGSLQIRYALGASRSRTVMLVVNESTRHRFEREVTFEPTGGWSRWSNLVVNEVPLQSSLNNTIRLESIGNDSGNVDQMTVWLVASCKLYQAEHANIGGGTRINRNHACYHDDGFLDFPRTAGFAEWTDVAGGLGGPATLSFRYALGRSAQRRVTLAINQSEQDLVFTPTSGWPAWSDLVVKQTPLRSGLSNTIRLETIGQDAGNLDEMVACVTAEAPIEAEDMMLDGYEIESNQYASGGLLIKTDNRTNYSKADHAFTGNSGHYDLRIFYFDEDDGESPFRVFVGPSPEVVKDALVVEWAANEDLNSGAPNSGTRTSRVFCNVHIEKDDRIRIEGKRNRGERARVDEFTISPHDENCLWDKKYAEIAKHIVPPIFDTDACLDVTHDDVAVYKDESEMEKDWVKTFAKAIDTCHRAGGGQVKVPSSNVAYILDGPITLRSNINLHLEEGSRIEFSGPSRGDATGFKRFPSVLTRYEGILIKNYSPLINATGTLDEEDGNWLPDKLSERIENVAITGQGTVDGGAWGRYWQNRDTLDRRGLRGYKYNSPPLDDARRVFGRSGCENEMSEDGTRPEDGNRCLLRPQMIQFYGARNVLVDGISINNCPFWCLHVVFSSNVTVRNVKFQGYVVNNDGIDLDSSRDVLIEDVEFDNDDDNIAIKSGRNSEGRMIRFLEGCANGADSEECRIGIPSRNVIIRGPQLRGRHGLAIGSEMSGDVAVVLAEDGQQIGDLNTGILLKSNVNRGGQIKQVRIRGMRFSTIEGGRNPNAIRMDMVQGATRVGDDAAAQRAALSDVLIQDLEAGETEGPAIFIRGFRNRTSGIRLRAMKLIGETGELKCFPSELKENDNLLDMQGVYLVDMNDQGTELTRSDCEWP